MNDFTFGNETKNFVPTRHYESADILCAQPVPAARLMLASGAIVATSVPFRLRMLSMDIASSHRVAWLLLSLTCVAVPVDLAPAIGGMPWKPFSSTRSHCQHIISQEAASEHR